jgi:hypothetical protein
LRLVHYRTDLAPDVVDTLPATPDHGPVNDRRELVLGLCASLPQVLQPFLQCRDFAEPGPVLASAGRASALQVISAMRGSWAGSTHRNWHRLHVCSSSQGVP